jgi:hypothetical protein
LQTNAGPARDFLDHVENLKPFMAEKFWPVKDVGTLHVSRLQNAEPVCRGLRDQVVCQNGLDFVTRVEEPLRIAVGQQQRTI